jgi:predicted anti-sigma-YlaC factor YlaD
MRCHDCRTALSARLDGEPTGFADAELDAHVAGCAACASHARALARLHRTVRLTGADSIPDLTPRILHAIGLDSSAVERTLGLRICLALVGILQIGLAVPALVFGDDPGLPVHTARHIGSFGVALAIGFLFVAWRPARAAGLLPVAVALVACLVGSSLLDLLAGRTDVLGETSHVTEIVGLAITWLLAGPLGAPVAGSAAR